MIQQATIQREVSISGKALHTGQEVELTFRPAPIDHGIVFRRLDLFGKPEIRPSIQGVGDLVRNTTICSGGAQLHTVEHVLSAVSGLGISNIIIDMTGAEPPILDGSAQPFVHLLQQAQIEVQNKSQDVFVLREPVCVTEGNRSIIAIPHDGLKITCTSADDRGVHTQHLSLDIIPQTYVAQLACARTFTIYEDIEPLIKLGKIQGGSLDSAIVIRGDKIISKEPLRFPDEFVRHKILDIVGDIVLLGKPLHAHIIAVRPGHALNDELTKKLAQQMQAKPKALVQPVSDQQGIETQLDVRRILDILPHRYPFLLIDKVLEIQYPDRLIAIKNVTINEPYFQGHFPGRPVMPGVLQLEAMAQAAGALLLKQMQSEGKIAFFMSCDQVKFRQPVVPGDQLMIHIHLKKVRGQKIAFVDGECRVNDKVVSSAQLSFVMADHKDIIA